MKKTIWLVMAIGAAACGFAAETFTLKSTLTGEFDWSAAENYDGEHAQGPQAGDTIVVPTGLTALMSKAAGLNGGLLSQCPLVIESGATVECYWETKGTSRYQNYVHSLSGKGTIKASSSLPTSVVDKVPNYMDLSILHTSTFEGTISGRMHYRLAENMTLTLTGDNSSCDGSPLFSDNSTLELGRANSYGNGNYNWADTSTVRYLGAEGLHETIDHSSYEGINLNFDSGLYGGVTFSLNINPKSYQRYVTLTGTATEVSSYYLKARQEGSLTPVYLRKVGTGTWKLTNANNSPISGVVEVQDGILQFTGDMAAMGTACSMGYANNLYKWGSASVPTEDDKIPYAILLGGESTEGILEAVYSGMGGVNNYDRKIGLNSVGGFKGQPNTRLLMKDISAASEGSKTLILEGEGTTNNCTAVQVADGNGKVGVEKRGAGKWTVIDSTFTGPVVVKAGELELHNGVTDFEWYRITFKQNGYFDEDIIMDDGRTLAAHAQYLWENDATKPQSPSASEKRKITLNEFMFFDAEGKRHGVLPLAHYKQGSVVGGKTIANAYTVAKVLATTDASMLQPNSIGVDSADMASRITSSSRPISALFEAAGYVDGKKRADEIVDENITLTYYNDWLDQTVPADPKLSDESSWRNIYIRMPAGTPKLTACDFISQYEATTKYSGRVLTAWAVAGSSDGINWYELLDEHVTSIMPKPASYSGAAVTSVSISAAALAKCFQFDYSKVPSAAAAKTIAVAVAKDATLTLKGAHTINQVNLIAEGMGTIAGSAVTLSEQGTFVVPSFSGKSKTFTTSLKDLTGAANLAQWTAQSASGVNYGMAYDPETGNVTVSRLPTRVWFK